MLFSFSNGLFLLQSKTSPFPRLPQYTTARQKYSNFLEQEYTYILSTTYSY
jgi:hypothetical protein